MKHSAGWVALVPLVPLVSFVLLCGAAKSHAYVHVVTKGETLAEIAKSMYGDASREVVIATANQLDAQGGSVIIPGMSLTIPAPKFVEAAAGDTWKSLAVRWLGHESREEVLAAVNNARSWVPPEAGRIVMVPVVLSHIASGAERMSDLARRYLGTINRAWELNKYNGDREGDSVLKRGEVILIPLVDLALTSEGKSKKDLACTVECQGDLRLAHDTQRDAAAELATFDGELRRGAFADALVRGARLVGSGHLTKTQEASATRGMVDALVALDAFDAARAACARYKALSPGASFDKRITSPKVLRACE